MRVCPEVIPDDLKVPPRWVAWRLQQRDGRLTKPPYDIKTGAYASATDPGTWSSYEDAVAVADQYDGIGFVLSAEDDIFGVDLDHCRDPQTGIIQPWAQAVMLRIYSYTEVSPSHTGIRIIGKGQLPGGLSGKRHGSIEVYASARYLTITGDHVEGFPTRLEERTTELAENWREWFPEPVPPRQENRNGAAPRLARPLDISDEELLDKARDAANGGKFSRLFDAGDVSGHGDDDSRADLALLGHLAFWTQGDRARMDRLFRSSALYREKWDESRGEMTYGEKSISMALEGRTEFYQPPRRPVSVDTDDDRQVKEPSAGDETASPETEHEPQIDPAPALPAFTLATPVDSFVSRYVTYASSCTDAPIVAHEAMAVGLLSAVAGPGVRLPMASHRRGWLLNAWLMYLADSTVARKSTTLGLAKDLLTAALGSKAVFEWEGSPQGLIQRLQERDGASTTMMRDEYSGLLAQMNRNGGHLAGLAQTLIRAYDGEVLENIRTRKKDKESGALRDDTDRVNQPYLVKLCASTYENFLERSTIDNVLDGLLARFAFVRGTSAWHPPKRRTPAMDAARDALLDHLNQMAARAGQTTALDLDDSVLLSYGELEQAWIAHARHSPAPSAASASLKRLSEMSLKVAGLLALDLSPSTPPRIDDSHFAAARTIVGRWLPSTLHVIASLGRSQFLRQCDAVFATIAAQPGITIGGLYRLHRSLKKRDFDEALGALILQERIVERAAKATSHGKAQGEGHGRPTRAFFSVHRKEPA